MTIKRSLKITGLTTLYIFGDKVLNPVLNKLEDTISYVKIAKNKAVEDVDGTKDCLQCNKKYTYVYGDSSAYYCPECAPRMDSYYATHTFEGVQVLDEDDLKQWLKRHSEPFNVGMDKENYG
jgi:hypothetical protein